MNNHAALNVKQVAELLSVDSKTVYRLAQRGEMPGFKVAGSWRFMRSDIEGWIEAQKLAPKDQRKEVG